MWTKGKIVVGSVTHNFTGTLVNWISLKGLGFARTTASDKEFTKDEIQSNAERLASCWNACLPFEHPEHDIPKIIEGLHLLLKGQMKETDSDRILERSCPNDEAIIKGFEALALYKEDK